VGGVGNLGVGVLRHGRRRRGLVAWASCGVAVAVLAGQFPGGGGAGVGSRARATCGVGLVRGRVGSERGRVGSERVPPAAPHHKQAHGLTCMAHRRHHLSLKGVQGRASVRSLSERVKQGGSHGADGADPFTTRRHTRRKCERPRPLPITPRTTRPHPTPPKTAGIGPSGGARCDGQKEEACNRVAHACGKKVMCV
jgi:hypothetical protein